IKSQCRINAVADKLHTCMATTEAVAAESMVAMQIGRVQSGLVLFWFVIFWRQKIYPVGFFQPLQQFYFY
ncbi:MAG: hypothetical protein JZU60_02385, partial [Ilumatobacteraceae bacterium]|nr:hypothetical protein [Ilumatobacteraceae bacterium]